MNYRSQKYEPILIIGFNRFVKIKNILDKLITFNDLNIYISIDGPRNHNDSNNIDLIKSEIKKISKLHNINCRFLPENLGCARHCVNAITWFLNCVEMGIILEDDIDFNHEFLDYASANLKRFKNDNSIYGISGSPYINIENDNKNFFLSKYPNIWGWATWKDRWDKYSLTIEGPSFIERIKIINNVHKNILITIYWTLVIELFRTSKINGWDHQFYYTMWSNKAFFLVPNCSLTKNIGFDSEGTYMTKKPLWQDILLSSPSARNSHLPPPYFSDYDQICEKYVYKCNIFTIIKLIIKMIILQKTWLKKRSGIQL